MKLREIRDEASAGLKWGAQRWHWPAPMPDAERPCPIAAAFRNANPANAHAARILELRGQARVANTAVANRVTEAKRMVDSIRAAAAARAAALGLPFLP